MRTWTEFWTHNRPNISYECGLCQGFRLKLGEGIKVIIFEALLKWVAFLDGLCHYLKLNHCAKLSIGKLMKNSVELNRIFFDLAGCQFKIDFLFQETL